MSTLLLRSLSALTLSAFVAVTQFGFAAEKSPQPQRETVEMFAAIEAGDIEVKLIPKDAKQANVIVTNKTKRPLSVKMPEAFAGVPVLAQFGGGGGGIGGQGGLGGQQGGAQQGVGGGFGGGGGGFGGGGQGGFGGGGGGQQGGFFNVEPEKAKKVKVAVMCLEHGKKDPSINVKYDIVPIETMTTKPDVIEVCKMLGRGEVDQVAAQAAVWHLENGLSWEELANKIGVKHLNGSVEPFFNAQQIELALKIAHVSTMRADELKTKTGKSESQSSQQ